MVVRSDSTEEFVVGWITALGLLGALGVFLAAYVACCVWLAIRARAAGLPAAGAPSGEGPPFDWLVPSAFAVVLGFTPFGIAALVHASRVTTLHHSGHLDAARTAARSARRLFWWSLAIGAFLVVAFTVLPWVAASIINALN
jgi:hypothetical protein